MKKILLLLLGLSLGISGLSLNTAQAATASAQTNLIGNPSLTQVDSKNQPVGWLQGQWGQLTASFIYNRNFGYQSTGSATVAISKYTSGDAKWYFTPVSVTPNQKYFFTDYFTASTKSEVVGEYTLTDGSLVYQEIGNLAKTSSWNGWQQASFTFTAPANAQKLTIFHLINSVGYLMTDSYSLTVSSAPTPPTPPIPPTPPVTPTPTPTPTPPAPTPPTPTPPTPPTPVITSNVPNASLEQTSATDSTQPLDWVSSNWGTNTTKFTYLTGDGHTGTHSVKTEITAYTDGDAKWYYTPQTMPGGATYQFTDYYKSNILSQVVLEIVKTDGTTQYVGLKNALPSSTWTQYSDYFTTPLDIKTLTVYHLIAGVGFLITDDYSVTPATITGFNRPLLTLTFDDSWEDNYTSVLPLLNQYGYKSTQFYATTYIQSQPSEQYKVKAFAAAGNEIGSHSISHPDLTKVSDAQLQSELKDSQSYLQNLTGKQVKSFATPFGAYDQRVDNAIQTYYTANRNTDAGYNGKASFDVMNIRVQNMESTTTQTEFQSWVDQAVKDKTWLVIVYHRVANDPEQYDTTPAKFAAQLAYVHQTGITVKTIQDSLAELLPQL